MFSENFHFPYKPTCQSVEDLSKRVSAGDLGLEDEAAEIAHLKYDLNIPTTKLQSELEEVQWVTNLVSLADLTREEIEAELQKLPATERITAKKIIEIAIRYRNASKKNTN